MNENIDLTKILKDCPVGWHFWSSVYGEVDFIEIYSKPVLCNPRPREDEWLGQEIHNSEHPILFDADGFDHRVSSRGEMIKGRGECTFFPSRDQRDWSKFTAPWYKKEKMDTIAQIEKQRDKDKDKLIQELGKYKVKYTQEVLEKYINNMSNKNNERLRKTTIAFLKDFAEQGYENAVECIDWLEKQREQEEHKFKVGDKLIQNKFDPKTLQPFDRVLARIDGGDVYCWFADFVSTPTIEKYDILPCIMSNKGVKMIIPYNDDTKHLVGTTEEAPEFYKYWEK